MANLNRVQLIGRLGQEPEVRYTPNGTQLTNFRMAVDHFWKAQDGQRRQETDWFSVEAWGRQGEVCREYLHKGNLVYVEGQIRIDQWDNDKGERQTRPKILLRSFQFLEPRRNGDTEPEVEESEGDPI